MTSQTKKKKSFFKIIFILFIKIIKIGVKIKVFALQILILFGSIIFTILFSARLYDNVKVKDNPPIVREEKRKRHPKVHQTSILARLEAQIQLKNLELARRRIRITFLENRVKEVNREKRQIIRKND